MNLDIHNVMMKNEKQKSKCLHKSCPDCNGTGRKKNGELCVHFISCPCDSCNPKF